MSLPTILISFNTLGPVLISVAAFQRLGNFAIFNQIRFTNSEVKFARPRLNGATTPSSWRKYRVRFPQAYHRVNARLLR